MKSLHNLGIGLLINIAGGFVMALLLKLSEFFIIFIFGIAPVVVVISTYFYVLSTLFILKGGMKFSFITKFALFIFLALISYLIFTGFTVLFSNVLGVENRW